MRALITGASGFLGSHLTEWLVETGHAVAVLHRPRSDLWRIQAVLPKVTTIRADLEALPDAAGAVAHFAPDVVFHTAWYGVGSRHRDEEGQVDRNIQSSLSLTRLACRIGCKAFVGLGSQAEYGPHNRRINETAATEPTTLYGAAKLSVFHLCRRIAALSGMRFVWARVFSAYGPRDNPEWMIPYLIRELLARERPSLTPGEQQWDYVFATDVAKAVCLLGLCPRAEGPFNLGSGQVHSIRSIVERIRDLIDPTLPLGLGEVPYRADQVMHLQADTTRLETVTGWRPEVPLETGLRRTVEWYRSQAQAELERKTRGRLA